MKDLISVIIPVYNVENYLEKCIKSVLAQTEICFEIILVDDGSTDSSPLICDRFSALDSRIIVLHKNNEGLGFARNSGLDVAKGNFIFFLDSDDWIPVGSLEYLYNLIKKTEADIITFNYLRTKDTNEICITEEDESIILLTGSEIMKNYFQQNSTVSWCRLYKKQIFDHVKFTNLPLHEDAYSMHLFLQQAKQVLITNKICYIQYVRPGSLINKPFSQDNFIGVECGKRMVEFSREYYPDVLKYAYINLIKRQIYTIDLILTKSIYSKYKKEYCDILKELKENIENINELKDLDVKLYCTSKIITKFPTLYKIFLVYLKLFLYNVRKKRL